MFVNLYYIKSFLTEEQLNNICDNYEILWNVKKDPTNYLRFLELRDKIHMTCEDVDPNVDLIITNELIFNEYIKLINLIDKSIIVEKYSIEAINGLLVNLPGIKPDKLKEMVNEFVRNFADKDQILEKITNYGIESLIDVDYEVLRSK